MISPEDKFKKHLKRKKLKFTPERKIILKTIFSLHGHFDIDKLYERISKFNKHISRATIYRTLPLLLECGLVRETMKCEAKASYEHVYGHDHHDHLVCIKCGRIIEFSNDRIEKLQDEICNRYNFMPVEHRLGIKGYCERCKKRKT